MADEYEVLLAGHDALGDDEHPESLSEVYDAWMAFRPAQHAEDEDTYGSDGSVAVAAYANSDTRRSALGCLERLKVAYHKNMELECEDTSEPFKYLCSGAMENAPRLA